MRPSLHDLRELHKNPSAPGSHADRVAAGSDRCEAHWRVVAERPSSPFPSTRSADTPHGDPTCYYTLVTYFMERRFRRSANDCFVFDRVGGLRTVPARAPRGREPLSQSGGQSEGGLNGPGGMAGTVWLAGQGLGADVARGGRASLASFPFLFRFDPSCGSSMPRRSRTVGLRRGIVWLIKRRPRQPEGRGTQREVGRRRSRLSVVRRALAATESRQAGHAEP